MHLILRVFLEKIEKEASESQKFASTLFSSQFIRKQKQNTKQIAKNIR